jgi:hypothetical protein
MRRILRLPDLIGLLLGQVVALVAGLLIVPVNFRFRRSEERLRHPKGAWGWAIVDGYMVWLLLSINLLGFWLALRFGPDNLFCYALPLPFYVGSAFIFSRTKEAVCRNVMRWVSG